MMLSVQWVLITFLALTSLVHAGDDTADLEIAAQSNAHFAKTFFKEVSGGKETDLICSPLSAHLALGLVRLAAKGTTRSQISTALHLKSQDDVDNSFKRMLAIVKSQNGHGTTMRVVNRVFVKKDLKLRKKYQDSALTAFGAKAKPIDFVRDGEIINEIVSNTTRGKIKRLVNPSTFDSNTAAVLVNALYFQGTWKKAFEPVTSFPFHLNNGSIIRIPFLNTKANFYTKNVASLNADVIDIPYQGDTLSFLIILPARGSSLSELEMMSPDITKIATELRSEPINSDLEVYIPKFKLETSINLKEPLQNLGMTSMFNEEKSDLSGLVRSRAKLFVSEAFQKTVIEVSEKGTEAASGTYFQIQSRMYVEKNEFKATRPFLFYVVLHEKNQRFVLFSGRFTGQTAQ